MYNAISHNIIHIKVSPNLLHLEKSIHETKYLLPYSDQKIVNKNFTDHVLILYLGNTTSATQVSSVVLDLLANDSMIKTWLSPHCLQL
jgi:hypothetical protein